MRLWFRRPHDGRATAMMRAPNRQTRATIGGWPQAQYDGIVAGNLREWCARLGSFVRDSLDLVQRRTPELKRPSQQYEFS
jgi:hypothetical protein